MKAQFLVLASVLALSSAACSSSTDSTTPVTKTDSGTDGSATDTGTTPTTDTGTTPTTDTGTTPTGDTGMSGGDTTCTSMADNASCQSCCRTNHMTAYQAFVKALLDCGCKTGNCDTACKTTACASPMMNPDMACTTCLQGVQSGACKTDLQTACTGSGPCADFATCVSGCPKM